MSYFGKTAASASVVETAYALGMLSGSLLLGLWGGTRNKVTAMTAALFCMGGLPAGGGRSEPGGLPGLHRTLPGHGPGRPLLPKPPHRPHPGEGGGDYLGRVLGLTSAVMTLAGPVGLAATALFAEEVGLTRWFALAGGVTALCGVLCLALPAVRRCGGTAGEKICPEG